MKRITHSSHRFLKYKVPSTLKLKAGIQYRKSPERGKAARLKFQRAIKLVRIINYMRPKKLEKVTGLSAIDTYTTLTDFADNLRPTSNKMFDASVYKANKEIRVSNEVKTLLLQPETQKLPSQVAKTMLSLKSIQTFATYPTRMQRKLVEVGWYECHNRKRIILRQGHPPHAFYFILSGTVSVKVLKRDEVFARTLCYLKKGDSFGELSIIHSTHRQATIITEDTTELLCISKKDFIDIFMSSGLGRKNVYDPDFDTFIKHIKFLKGWPIDQLYNSHRQCLFNYFSNGSVLAKDSNYSDWIYVIKSGSCRVLKRLRKAPMLRKESHIIRTRAVSKVSDTNYITSGATEARKISIRINMSTRSNTSTNHSRQSTTETRKLRLTATPTPNMKISIIDSTANKHLIKESYSDKHACFVQLATLEKGDTFGLQQMFCNRPPSLSLVSNGAEILLISKKYFIENCSNSWYFYLQRTVPDYPEDEWFQDQLERLTKWNEYKVEEMQKLSSQKTNKRSQSAKF